MVIIVLLLFTYPCGCGPDWYDVGGVNDRFIKVRGVMLQRHRSHSKLTLKIIPRITALIWHDDEGLMYKYVYIWYPGDMYTGGWTANDSEHTKHERCLHDDLTNTM